MLFFITWNFSEQSDLLVSLGNPDVFMLIKTRVTRTLFFNYRMIELMIEL